MAIKLSGQKIQGSLEKSLEIDVLGFLKLLVIKSHEVVCLFGKVLCLNKQSSQQTIMPHVNCTREYISLDMRAKEKVELK